MSANGTDTTTVQNSNGNSPAERHEKGRELLVKRTNTAFDDIRKIGNTANKTYGLLPAEWGAALGYLRAEIDRVEQMFLGGKVASGGFELSEQRSVTEPAPKA